MYNKLSDDKCKLISGKAVAIFQVLRYLFT